MLSMPVSLDILVHEIVLKLLKTGGQKALVCFHGKIIALHTVLNRNSEAERKKVEIVYRLQLVTFTSSIYMALSEEQQVAIEVQVAAHQVANP